VPYSTTVRAPVALAKRYSSMPPSDDTDMYTSLNSSARWAALRWAGNPSTPVAANALGSCSSSADNMRCRTTDTGLVCRVDVMVFRTSLVVTNTNVRLW
jgi:hypothetical protein